MTILDASATVHASSRTHKRYTKNKGIEKIEKVARCQGSNPIHYGMVFLLLSGMRYIKGNETTLLGNVHETTNIVVKKSSRNLRA